jgi:hypothetical protein
VARKPRLEYSGTLLNVIVGAIIVTGERKEQGSKVGQSENTLFSPQKYSLWRIYFRRDPPFTSFAVVELSSIGAEFSSCRGAAREGFRGG